MSESDRRLPDHPASPESKAVELPGMLALAEGVAAQRWPHTMDARVWVDEWQKTIAINPGIPLDEGAMIGWFANAIMAGYDTAKSRATPPTPKPESPKEE